MKTIENRPKLTLKATQHIITLETKRKGMILAIPSNATVDNNNTVLVLFEDGQEGWMRPSHMMDEPLN